MPDRLAASQNQSDTDDPPEVASIAPAARQLARTMQTAIGRLRPQYSRSLAL